MWLAAVARATGKGPWPALLSVSLLGWTLLAVFGHAPVMVSLCGGHIPDVLGWGAASASLALRVNGAAALTACWGLMLLAMTPPLLAQPIRRIWRASLARRRAWAIAAFLAAYGLVWLAVGPLFMALAAVLGALGLAGVGVAAGLSLAWGLLPLRRACLGRAHRAPRLRIFGIAAVTDAARYGAASGLWCVAACWPLMLAPLLAGAAELPVMTLTAALTAAQRLLPVSAGRWDPPLRVAAFSGP